MNEACHNSTAGAATPFVTTAMRLKAGNDDVRSVLGSLSGVCVCEGESKRERERETDERERESERE